MDNFEEYLESIDEERKCSFFSLPFHITVGQAKQLYEKYLILIKDNDFLIKETKRRLTVLNHYPDYWEAINAFQVEDLVCNQTND